MEPFTLLHKKGLSMRFQVPINSTFSQKAIFLNSEYLKDSLLPYNIVCIRNPFFIIIRFFYILVYHRNKHVQINVFYYFFFSFRIGDKMYFKEILSFIENDPHHSCMYESLYMKFQSSFDRLDRKSVV